MICEIVYLKRSMLIIFYALTTHKHGNIRWQIIFLHQIFAIIAKIPSWFLVWLHFLYAWNTRYIIYFQRNFITLTHLGTFSKKRKISTASVSHNNLFSQIQVNSCFISMNMHNWSWNVWWVLAQRLGWRMVYYLENKIETAEKYIVPFIFMKAMVE